ncbi:MAG: 50S ribosomal protein L29 [Patescibacteria group bacterium]|jgi:ribosomal protein L29
MDFADLKNKSKGELADLMKEMDQKLFMLRLQSQMHRLKQVHEIKQVRKTIARISMLVAAKLEAKK